MIKIFWIFLFALAILASLGNVIQAYIDHNIMCAIGWGSNAILLVGYLLIFLYMEFFKRK